MKTGKFSTNFNALFLLILGILSAGLGFIREIQIAAYFGLSIEADMFYIGSLLPDLIVSIVGSTTTNIYMREYDKTSDKKSYTTSTLFVLSAIVLIILVFLEIFFPYVATLIATTYVGEELHTFINVGRIMLASISVSVFLGVIVGTLNMNGKFILTGFNGLIYNVLLIVSTYILVPYQNIYGLAWSYLIANIFRVLFLLPGIRGCLSKINIRSTFLLLKEAPKIALTNLILNLQVNIERSIASTINTGAVAALNYAGKISGLPSVLFINSILTVAFPKFIEYANKKEQESFSRVVLLTLKVIVFGLVFAELFFVIFNKEIINILLRNGKFTQEDSVIVANLIIYYAPIVTISGANQVLMKVAYSVGKTSLTVFSMITALLIYVVTSFLFKDSFGIYGLALSLIIYNVVMLFVLFIGLNREEDRISIKFTISHWYSICLFIVLVLVTSRIFAHWTNISLLYLTGCSILYTAIFFIFLYCFDKDFHLYAKENIFKLLRRRRLI